MGSRGRIYAYIGKICINLHKSCPKIGKRQAYAAGRLLRTRYGNLIPDQFDTSKMSAYSSSADRCQMTLQTMLAGAFPPVDYAEWGKLQWQPISYKIDNPVGFCDNFYANFCSFSACTRSTSALHS